MHVLYLESDGFLLTRRLRGFCIHVDLKDFYKTVLTEAGYEAKRLAVRNRPILTVKIGLEAETNMHFGSSLTAPSLEA